jgi:hypothetical protein
LLYRCAHAGAAAGALRACAPPLVRRALLAWRPCLRLTAAARVRVRRRVTWLAWTGGGDVQGRLDALLQVRDGGERCEGCGKQAVREARRGVPLSRSSTRPLPQRLTAPHSASPVLQCPDWIIGRRVQTGVSRRDARPVGFVGRRLVGFVGRRLVVGSRRALDV